MTIRRPLSGANARKTRHRLAEAEISSVERAQHMNKAIEDIATERRRQQEVHGCTVQHDANYVKGELAAAGAAYALSAAAGYRSHDGDDATWVGECLERIWPWDSTSWKPKGARQDLVRAAALIVAEIERLDQIEQHKGE